MNQKIIYILILITLAVIFGIGFFTYKKYLHEETLETPSAENSKIQEQFALPIAEFSDRITKKPFGIYVTPQKSPVNPERFTGYHTAVDIEYDDKNEDVPVYAIADGKIELARWASGYGGVIVLSFNLDEQKTLAIYGHLRPSSFTDKTEVRKGEQLAVLGTGYSYETDNERKHLHFGILKKDMINLLGYVATESALLGGWYNPLDIVK